MPTLRLTKAAIDALPVGPKDQVFWDEHLKGFGVKVTPAGRKVFIVLYRTAGGVLRKYTIGPYGRVTPHLARIEAQKILAARLEGRDPAREKREAGRRHTVDRIENVVDLFAAQHLASRRSGAELTRVRCFRKADARVVRSLVVHAHRLLRWPGRPGSRGGGCP